MERHKFVEEMAANVVLDLGGLQAGSDALEQRRHSCGELAALFAALLGLHAPDQLVHRFDGLRPRITCRSAPDVNKDQQFEPLLDEKLKHRPRQRICLDSHADLLLRVAFSHRERFLPEYAFGGRARLVFDALVFPCRELDQILTRSVKDRDVLVIAQDKLAQNALNFPEQLALVVEICGQADRDLGQCVEQLPGRMGLL